MVLEVSVRCAGVVHWSLACWYKVLAMVEVDEVSCKCMDDIGREGDAL